MKPLYRPEPLIPATLKTAAANLAILRTQAGGKVRDLTSKEQIAAMCIAVYLEKLVYDHARKPTAL